MKEDPEKNQTGEEEVERRPLTGAGQVFKLKESAHPVLLPLGPG